MSAYSGRTIDLMASSVPSDTGNNLLTLSFGTAGKVCTGIQKAAQVWYIAFLTDRGSMRSDPTYGTEFLQLARVTNMYEPANVRTIFSTAVSQLQTWFRKNLDLEIMPDDEVITSASLLNFTMVDGKLTLQVLLESRAGEQRVLIAPISVVPIGS